MVSVLDRALGCNEETNALVEKQLLPLQLFCRLIFAEDDTITQIVLVKWLEDGVPQGSLCKSPEEKCPDVLRLLVLLICVTKVVKSASDKALAEHEDIDDAVGLEEPTERDHGLDLHQPLLIKIYSSDSPKK
ncbi:hypothetical protein OROHE_008032 [Orobanche hederae]